jgi:hypothetical protein
LIYIDLRRRKPLVYGLQKFRIEIIAAGL